MTIYYIFKVRNHLISSIYYLFIMPWVYIELSIVLRTIDEICEHNILGKIIVIVENNTMLKSMSIMAPPLATTSLVCYSIPLECFTAFHWNACYILWLANITALIDSYVVMRHIHIIIRI